MDVYVAVAVPPALIVTEQVPVPVHVEASPVPDQPGVKLYPLSGVAVRNGLAAAL